MKPIDLLGFGPKREAAFKSNGMWEITVTPPAIVGGDGCKVELDAGQYARYQQWERGSLMIQEALPELSASQREALMTGLSDDEFHAAAQSDVCPDCQGTGGLYASHGGVVLDQPCKTCGGEGHVEPVEAEDLTAATRDPDFE